MTSRDYMTKKGRLKQIIDKFRFKKIDEIASLPPLKNPLIESPLLKPPVSSDCPCDRCRRNKAFNNQDTKEED